MTLERYLIKNGISTARFARLGNFPFHSAVKWRQRSRIPRPESLLKIEKLTKGEVNARDWYCVK